MRSGVAEMLPDPVWMDAEGNIVELQADTFGCKVGIKATHPNCFAMEDETGCNTNMKTDGHVGGNKFMGEAGTTCCNKKAITTSMHFAVLPLQMHLANQFYAQSSLHLSARMAS